MTNRFLISAAVAALIAGSGFANAQGTGSQGGGMSREAPSAGSMAQPSAPSSDRGGAASGSMQRDNSAPGMKGAESEGTKGGKDGMNSAQSREGMSKDGMKGEKSAHDGMTRDGAKNAQSKDGMSKDGMKDAQSKDGMSKDSATTRDGKSGTTTGNAATSATAAPPAEKRTQISTAIRSEKIEQTTNVNFNISVGTAVPSTVRFHPLPPRIVEIYPEWSGYEVILVSGRYIIVRPQTREIVYIIEG